MTTQRGTVNKFLSTSALTLGLIASASATANAMDANTTPTGEQVVAGSANFDRPDTSTLNINQNTDRVVINWDSFDIGSNAKTEFFQPGSGSLAVNRVTGRNSDPTQILGTLKANGRVMVLDRNGVVFGAGSRVDVGGIVASTGDVNDDAVMRGDTKLELSNFGDASVINNGTISVTGAGLAALVAPHVANNGVIEARLGKVVLASGGERATVDLYGDGLVEIAVGGAKGKALVENSGVISGATVLMTASGAKEVVDTVINMSGVVQATSATVQGGKIILNGGNAGKVKVSGTIDASGAAGGGDIKVIGEDIEVTQGAVVTADALTNGNGGSIYFMGGNNAIYRGRFFARGGEIGGNGGFVELSAKNEVGYDGSVSTMAVNGLAGSFLIDPLFAIIHSGGLHNPLGLQYILSAEALARDLYNNGSVTVQADNSIDVGTDVFLLGNGDIDLSRHEDWHLVDVNPHWFWVDLEWVDFGGETTGNLNLISDVVNFNKNLTLGHGDLNVTANTVNLNAKISDLSGLLDQSSITSTASLVNVLSNAANIQQGVYLASTGGTVDVKAGLYNQGDIQIKKALTVLGAGAGQTIVNAQGYGAAFMVYSGDVTIDGFDIHRDPLSGSGAGAAIWVVGQGWTTAANAIGNITIGDNGTGRGGNTIQGGFAQGVLLTQGNINNVNIVGNTFDGVHTAVRTNGSYQAGRFGNLNIAENVIDNVVHGADLAFLTSDNAITNNVFNNVGYYNITTSSWDASADLRVHNNSFDANAQRLIDNWGGFTVNASGNWWGTNNEATIASKMFGSVDFTPFLMGGADTSAARGFQGDFSNLFVTALGAQTGTVGRVQEGVDDVTVGGTVTVGDGTFNENVLVYKSMLLQSANGMNATTIAGVTGLGADSVIKITADDVTLGGVGHGFNVVGNGLGYGINVANADDVSVIGNQVGGSAGSAINVSSSDAANIAGNTVLNAGANGIHLDQVNGATVTGNNVSNAAFSGIQALWGRDLDINNNVVANSGANGIALMAVGGVNAVSDNTIDGTGVDGVYANNVAGLTVDGNDIGTLGVAGNIKRHGVNVEFSNDANVANNTIKNVAKVGVNINSGSNVTVDGNTLSAIGNQGILTNQVQGLDITGNSLSNVSWSGVQVEGGRTLLINDNDLDNVRGNGVQVSGTNGVEVSDNEISNIRLAGVYVQGTTGATLIGGNNVTTTGSDGIWAKNISALTVSGNNVNDTTGDGIETITTHNAVIAGNTLGSIDGNAIFVTGSNNVRIGGAGADKNTVTSALLDGVKLEGGDNADVLGNSISNTGRVGIYSNNATNLLVDGNTLNTNTFAIGSPYGAVTIEKGSNTIVSNNFISNSTQGVRMMWVDGVNKITGNTVDTLTHNGIHAEDVDGLTVDGNKVGTLGGASNVKGNGINVAVSNGAQVLGNTVQNVAKTGVNIDKGSNVAVSGNTLTHIGNVGVRTEQVLGLTMAGNILSDISWSGMQVEGGRDVSITGNDLDNVRGNGVQVSGSNGAVNVLGNEVSNIRLSGIVVNGAPGTTNIKNNIVSTVGEYGIHAKNSKNVTVDTNTVTGGKNGIVVEGSTGTTKVNKNVVSGATDTNAGRVASDYQTGTGILVKNTTGTVGVTGNTSNGNSGDGIRVLNTNGATVSGNTAHNNGDKGIIIKNSDNVVVDNNKADNNDTGIWVELSDGVKLTNNVVQFSDVDGVHLRDSDNTLVQGNQILSNDRNGIFVERSDNADIFRNTITGSGGYTGVKVTGSSNTDIGATDQTSWVQTGFWPWQGHFVTTVRGNTITNFDNGVTVAGGNDNDVVRNTISGVDYGVRLSGATNSDVLDNDLAGNSIVGIEVVAGSHNAVIDNNTLDHFDTGIVVNGSNNVDVTNNDLTDVGSGIAADASNGLRVTGNDLTGRYNGGTAISVTNSDDVIIGGGTFLIFPVGVNSAEGFRDGIYANNVSNLHIRQNDLTGYGRGAGIDVRNSDGAIIGGVDILTSYGNDVDGYKDGIRVAGSKDAVITHNDVTNSVENGITVRNSNRADVSDNTVTFSGNNGITVDSSRNVTVGDNLVAFFGGDGVVALDSEKIEIANNIVGLGLGSGIVVDGGDDAHIHGNMVGLLVGDGIVVAGAENSLIENNLIALVGGNGVTLKPGSGYDFSDGSEVRNNTIMFVGGNGVDSYDTFGLVVDSNVITNVAGNGVNVEISQGTKITNNVVDGFGGHGIAVDDENGSVDIAFNTIQNGSGDAINVRDSENVLIRRNLIGNVGADGIDVANSDLVDIRRNVIDNVGADGVDVSDNRVVTIRRNTISNVGDNGIEADGNRRVRIARNDISNAANNGIMIDENNRVRIVSNLITNSGNAGLYAAGADNGVVILEDNVFTGNPIGAWFESGIIDLTGATNTFNGGDIGMRFAPVGNPNDLTLVGNTIGTTTFNGQSQYYIELANAAFFAPGLPTILNGLDASYDGFVPNSVGGILTQAQFDAIESKIYHFNDDGSLGLFFFGAVPGINDEDVYNRFGDLNWAGGRFRMTILGLPSVPGAGANRVGANSPAGQPGFTGNVAEFLANLAPAAGGDDQQDGQQQRGQSISIAGQLADLEPAAGGEGGEVSCWSDAMSQAAGGGAVNYSFGGSMEESLSQAASCGGAI
ncbi:right-handed parallel beta-helix repeat-containing protein [Micavibrio aeruginosavorus]|uniref:right-handed parallel beta-helix repeat-containing protein n=1 Tax=Micavibrio aeruginosavorus TaxID=349221 RepID=UPI003F4AF724